MMKEKINTAVRMSRFSSIPCNLERYILLELYIISPKPATSKAKADTAYVAQLVEQRYRKPQVVSSNLTVGSYGNKTYNPIGTSSVKGDKSDNCRFF